MAQRGQKIKIVVVSRGFDPINYEPCHIIEIQYGEAAEEEDIERLSYFEES